MKDEIGNGQGITRRHFLRQGAAAAAAVLLTSCVGEAAQEEISSTPTATARQAAGGTAQGSATTTPGASSVPATATAAPVVTATPMATATEEATSEASATPPETALLEPTPQCDDDDDEVTLEQTEGPYFTPNSPERTSLLEAGMAGTRLVVTGRVLSTGCQPVAGALIDFWQADDAGEYDNVGYRLRGHQFTDEQGQYRLETVVPGLYPGRTRHLHVKVQAPNQPVLTTQQYFPDAPGNASDGIFHPALVMAVEEGAEGMAATFDYVLAMG